MYNSKHPHTWDDSLPYVQHSYNRSLGSSIGHNPFQVWLGQFTEMLFFHKIQSAFRAPTSPSFYPTRSKRVVIGILSTSIYLVVPINGTTSSLKICYPSIKISPASPTHFLSLSATTAIYWQPSIGTYWEWSTVRSTSGKDSWQWLPAATTGSQLWRQAMKQLYYMKRL